MSLLSESVTRAIGHSLLTAQKQSPHIFFAAGVVGVVGSAVMACKATLKLNDTLTDIQEDVENVKGISETAKTHEGRDYNESDYYKDLGYVYGRGGGKLVRLYGPAALVGMVSIAALTGSHVSLARRNTALTATLASLGAAYEAYRERVREEVGAERELDIYRGVKTVEAEDAPGTMVKVVTDPNGWSPYARIFDEQSTVWEKSAELNRLYVQCQQTYTNHLLRARGHVFLNEVYDLLGLERSQAGSVVGWVMNGEGDNYIDFGMFEMYNSRFINGNERSIILDFNVDGVIYDKI